MTYASVEDFKRRKPFKWWHEKIIDDMISFPLSTLQERCTRLGRYTPASLSMIINSDMFQAKYQARRDQLSVDLDTALVQKTAACANEALDIMLETMQKKRDKIGFAALADFADKSLSKLGYGAKVPAGGVQVNVHQNNGVLVAPPVSKEQLQAARQSLREVEQRRAQETAKKLPAPQHGLYVDDAPDMVIDVEVEEVPTEDSEEGDAARFAPSD